MYHIRVKRYPHLLNNLLHLHNIYKIDHMKEAPNQTDIYIFHNLYHTIKVLDNYNFDRLYLLLVDH